MPKFLESFVSWAEGQPDVLGVALVGSHARAAVTDSSDVDLIVLTIDIAKYFRSQAWLSLFGAVETSAIEKWVRVQTIRTFYKGGAEIEYNFAAPEWATVPVDSGTCCVVNDGMKILHDPKGILEALRKGSLFESGPGA